MKKLTPKQYDEAEFSGASTLSNTAIAAYTPITFQHVRFPTHIHEVKSIVRFIDSMQEGDKYYDKQRRYSEYEQKLILGVVRTVRELSQNEFGKTICPWAAPLAAVYSFRIIKAMSEMEKRKLSVFEFGPGSGYLGALLASAEHKYGSMDITQSFYLWQNWFYQALVGDDLAELVLEHEDMTNKAKITHIPWWRFVTFQGNVPFEADVVICDGAIAEMSRDARYFALNSAKNILRDDGPKIFLVPNPGGTWLYSMQDIVDDFVRCGFDLINVFGFHAFTCSNSKFSKYKVIDHRNIYSKRIAHRTKRWLSRNLLQNTDGKFYTEFCEDPNQLFYEPTGNEKTVSATDIIKPDWKEAPLDYEFLDFINSKFRPAGNRP